MRTIRILLLVCAMSLAATGVDSVPAVPPEFDDLYAELHGSLTSFRSSVLAAWDGTRAPVSFSAHVQSASSARGELLLTTDFESVLLEVDSLKALGVKGVTVQISFPMLYLPFHGSDAEYRRYLAFYTRLAQEVRARGLKLIVESQEIPAKGGYSYWDVAPFYASLTTEQYQRGRMAVARAIAIALRPDYLSVIYEPDTEAMQTGKDVLGTPAGSRALLDVILAGVRAANVPGVAIGAGVGTWQADYRSYIDSFVTTAIDFVDVHVYPVNRDYLPRALEIADVAHAYGKQVGMTDAWLYKSRDSELDLVDFRTIFARDAFSFWAPLDALHLRAMVELAHLKGFAFMSPYWTGLFHAYVDYDDTTRGLPPLQLDAVLEAQQHDNLLGAAYTSTAIAYKNAIADTADVIPPAQPTNLAAQLTSPTRVVLTWSPSTDNVGTAGYRVFRDGVAVSQTALPHFIDETLAEATRYTYSVVAFDASGKASRPSSVTLTTPDMTSPSVPGNFVAVAARVGNQVNIGLSWSPSLDNVGVTHYRLFRGTSPDALTIIAGSTTTSFTLPNVPPDTTFYFGVSAMDGGYNESPQAAAVVTTPALPDRTPPNITITYPLEGGTISTAPQLHARVYDAPGGLYDVPSGPAGVQFFVDGVAVGAEQTVPYSGTTQYSLYRLQVDARRPLSVGDHVITAVARDKAGNRAAAPGVRVSVR